MENILKDNNYDLKLINMEDVEIEKIDWLLYPFIPYNKVTIIQGDPGEGKTTFVLQLIAKLTKGESILDNKVHEPINVIYQTAEDGLGDTIKPRLEDAGADCSRVLVIDDSDHPLTMRDSRLKEAIIETSARLVVLDPIQGFIGERVDMHRANEVRPLMKHAASLAEKYNCAFILIGHMNKYSQGKVAYRGLGSIDFMASTRSTLVIGRVKDEPEVRVVCQTKNSLAPEGPPIAFKLDPEDGFSWIGEYEIDAESLLSGGGGKGKKVKEAVIFLKEILSDNPVAQTEIIELATEKGIKESTLKNAKRDLNVKSNKYAGKWYWSLDDGEECKETSS